MPNESGDVMPAGSGHSDDSGEFCYMLVFDPEKCDIGPFQGVKFILICLISVACRGPTRKNCLVQPLRPATAVLAESEQKFPLGAPMGNACPA